MNISKNSINNLCIFFNVLLFLVIITAARPVFSATGDVDPVEDKNIYFEDFIQNWIKINASPSILEDIKHLLRYVVYSEIFAEYTLKVSIEKASNYGVPDFLSLPIVIDMLERYVMPARGMIYQKAVLNYLTKYGPNRPVIKKEEVSAFKKRAEKGDIQAIWELRRYYEHPDTENYNPEQTEARFWLFKAIEAGDEAAMLEAGYDLPYTVRTKLSYQRTTVILDAHCEKIDQSSSRPRPACFLFNLVISDQPKVVGHIILDQDHLSGRSLTPKELALKRINGQVMVELTSYADFEPALKRRDYFDLSGRYVARSGADFLADYFWNYHQAGPGDQVPILKGSLKQKELSRVPVRTLPYIEAFKFWEMEYPKTKRLTGFDGIFMPREDWSRAYDPDNTHRACQEKRDMMTQRDIEDEKRYERQRKFFALDPYEELRLDVTDPFIREALEIIHHELYYRYACEQSPRRAYYYYNMDKDKNPPGDTFKIYENLYENPIERPAYIIEYGSLIGSARMLQMCRYLGKSNVRWGPNNPCYAAQIKFRTKDGFRYHYVIDVIPNNSEEAPMNIIHTGLEHTLLDKTTTSQYIILINESSLSNTHLLEDRLDLFDEDFNYLGSNAWNLSKAMVPNAKPLPSFLVRKLEDGDIRFATNKLVQWYKFPEYTDMIIEQRRADNSKDS
ncbi:MAG: hypothetical protein LBP22_03660 [Deltaproteobacteria bacterium]|jgi:hypothetical protein|nr:hypothetical protein [Deltaproteobacteria bacterium]